MPYIVFWCIYIYIYMHIFVYVSIYICPPHISLFFIEINPSPSGQIFDKIWELWWHLALTIYPNVYSQIQKNPKNLSQTYIYFPPFSFLFFSFIFRPFPSLYIFSQLHQYFICFLNCQNVEKLKIFLPWINNEPLLLNL